METLNQHSAAILKDKILKYLSDHRTDYIEMSILKKDLKLTNLSEGVLKGYLIEMGDIDLINYSSTKDGGFARIKDRGEKLIVEGGFTEISKSEEEENKLAREKTKLEIQNLKLTRWLSIIAIVISIIALIISVH